MISLCPITPEIGKALTQLLQEDDALVKEIGATIPHTEEEFIDKTRIWQKNSNSQCFAILVDESPVGLASIGKRQGNSARCGFWYGSKYWGIGMGSEILHHLRKTAEAMGVNYLHSSVSSRPTIFDFDWNDEIGKEGVISTSK